MTSNEHTPAAAETVEREAERRSLPQALADYDPLRFAFSKVIDELPHHGGLHSDKITFAIERVTERFVEALSAAGATWQREQSAPKDSYTAKDALLSFCDPSNWDHDLKKGDLYRGWQEATEAVHQLVMDFWPELEKAELPEQSALSGRERAEVLAVLDEVASLEHTFTDLNCDDDFDWFRHDGTALKCGTIRAAARLAARLRSAPSEATKIDWSELFCSHGTPMNELCGGCEREAETGEATPSPAPEQRAEVTDSMLNAGQARLCELSNNTHFDDYQQAEVFKAMLKEMRSITIEQNALQLATDEFRRIVYRGDDTIDGIAAAITKYLSTLPRPAPAADTAPSGWEAAIEKIRAGLGAGGWGYGNSVEVEFGGIVLDAVSDALSELPASDTVAVPRETLKALLSDSASDALDYAAVAEITRLMGETP